MQWPVHGTVGEIVRRAIGSQPVSAMHAQHLTRDLEVHHVKKGVK